MDDTMTIDLFNRSKKRPPKPRRLGQNETILAALLEGRALSAFQALQEFGCFRLASRIHDINRMIGPAVQVNVEMVHRGEKRWAVYSLPVEAMGELRRKWAYLYAL